MSDFVPAPYTPVGITVTTNVTVTVGGAQHFRFDPENPKATTTSSLDPDQAAATVSALEAALDKARAVSAAYKDLAGA